ncbi:FUSC family membrane protein [Ignatzschineria larvae DSM 13226]|uniref:FUSC family membrane protein n=1 Tax=Ignatzschineria larvae DSM 13226 TaxID=1111732 RepID=A0ABZ3C1M9_9GAMM|nr:FUSC family membrane protein [Ignatzschineria larvae]
MQHFITATHRFFFSSDFAMGVKMALGIFIPVIFLYLFDIPLQILMIAGYGSLTMSIADQMGTLKHKRNEMLVTFIAIVVITLAFIFQPEGLHLLKITSLAGVSFVVAFIYAFRVKFIALGFIVSFTALLAASNYAAPPLVYIAYFCFGALFYFAFSMIISKVFQVYIIRQHLSGIYFQLSRYLQALSKCYRQNVDIEKEFKNFINSQTELLEELQVMRDVLFRLDYEKDHRLNQMVNELLLLIETREIATIPLQDFVIIRDRYPNSDLQIFFRDSFAKAGRNLEEMGMYSLRAGDMLKRLGFKAELRALEYELELLRRKELAGDDLDAYQIVANHFRKVWSLSRNLERIRTFLVDDEEFDTVIPRHKLKKFLSHSYWSNDYIIQNLTLRSPVLRFAIRSSLAMFFALLLVSLTNFLTHGFWIAFTLLSLMRPGFSLTKERSRNRIIGTIIGCLIGGVLISIELSTMTLLSILFISVILNNGLIRIHNPLSVTFTTVYVLILLNISKDLTMMQGVSLSIERIIDTLIGAAIALSFSHVLPSWEKINLPKLLSTARESLYNVMVEIEKWKLLKENDDDADLKLALRTAQASIVALSNSLERMKDEPVKKREHDITAINDELIEMQSILSQLSYLTGLLERVDTLQVQEFKEIFQLLKRRMDPNLHKNFPKAPKFTMRELKPLIWLVEPE